jgi:hypothetical protein
MSNLQTIGLILATLVAGGALMVWISTLDGLENTRCQIQAFSQ